MKICFGPEENPRDALLVLDDDKIAAARRAMSLVTEAPDLKVVRIEASICDAGVQSVSVEAFVTHEGKFDDGSWDVISLDNSELERPGILSSPSEGQSRRYTTYISGVGVEVILRRRFF